jgi:hypothetical protein
VGPVRRRRFLKTGVAGASTLALAGGGLALWPPALRTPRGELCTLTAAEYSVLAAVSDRVSPALGAGAPGGLALDVAGALDQELAYHDASTVDGVRTLLHALESGFLGALFGERLRPFTRLRPADQDRILVSWRSSDLGVRRTAYKVLRSLTAGAYFASPATWRRIGYPGPPSVRALREAHTSNLVDFDQLLAVEERTGMRAEVDG